MIQTYFLDIEASSLSDNSYPIELAWVDETGKGESYLIQPAPRWRDWSPKAEALHGISREVLLKDGAPPIEVAQRVADVLGREGIRLVSDEPEFDAEWLARLFATAYLARLPRISHVTQLYREACAPLARKLAADEVEPTTRTIISQAKAAEALRHRTRHRAAADAHGLWWIWTEIRKQAAERLARVAENP